MKLLVDANFSPRVGHRLAQAGHDVRHVFDVGLGTATDEQILEVAAEADWVVVSSDSDFGTLLARHNRPRPSFVLLRHGNELTPIAQAEPCIWAATKADGCRWWGWT